MQPDTATSGGPQGLNRYSYVANNPVNFNDPTGHIACDDTDENGKCVEDKLAKLLRHVDRAIFDKDGKVRKNHIGLSIMLSVVRKAAQIYGNDWDGFLSATNYVFLGVYGNGPFSEVESVTNGHQGEFQGYKFPVPNGMSRQFDDNSDQVRHFWGAFATAASSNRLSGAYGLSIPNSIIANGGNILHDVVNDWAGEPGTTIWDYSLSQTAIDIGKDVVSGNIATPADLAPILSEQLTNGNDHYNTNVYSFQWLWKTPFK